MKEQSAGRTVRVSPEGLERFACDVLTRSGLRPDDAQLTASVLVRTDLRGVHTHGTALLPMYLNLIDGGAILGSAEFRVVSRNGSAIVVDGDGGQGHAIACRATALAIEAATEHGVATVLVRNSNHFGPCGHYALLCAEAGLVAIVMSNAAPTMTVTGSRARVLSNAPTAYAVPRAGGFPIVLDIAMSATAGASVLRASASGEQIPEGWIVDGDGRPSTNPSDYTAEAGALVPIGGHKGYGLALLVELLAGVLAGAAVASAVGNPLVDRTRPSGTGHSLIVLDPSAFMPAEEFSERVNALVAEVHAAPLAVGANRIYVPGELEDERESAGLRDGLPLPKPIWEALLRIAREAGHEDELTGIAIE